MKAYVLSIVGMILLLAVVDIILPEGKMGSYTKGMLALFLFFVVVSPMVQFFKKSDNFVEQLSSSFDFSSESAALLQVSGLKNQVESSLKNNFGLSANVEILHNSENGVANIFGASVWVEEMADKEHKTEVEQIKSHVAAMLKIDESEVSVYE